MNGAAKICACRKEGRQKKNVAFLIGASKSALYLLAVPSRPHPQLRGGGRQGKPSGKGTDQLWSRQPLIQDH